MTSDANDPERHTISHRSGDPLPDDLRLSVGDEIVIILHGSPAYGWTAVTTSDDHVVAVHASSSHGTTTAVAHALGVGTATLRSTATFSGDRFGPQTRLWQLRVHVTS